MTLDMTGLRADTAHGYLAALGVMQALRRGHADTRMSWTDEFIPHAVLHGIGTPDDLIAAILADRDHRLDNVVLNFPKDRPFETLGVSRTDLDEWAAAIELADKQGDTAEVDLWSALVAEGGFTDKGKSKPTHFDFTAGQQKFLKIARAAGTNLTSAQLEEAIIGPWLWRGSGSTLRFEATGERLGALRATPPGGEKVRGVPGADWLAFLGLAYYPLALRAGNDGRSRVVTPACDAGQRSNFRWPVWTEPLPHRTVAATVTHPDLVSEKPDARKTSLDDLRAMGISSVWQCPIKRFGQGYGSFGPSSRIARSS